MTKRFIRLTSVLIGIGLIFAFSAGSVGAGGVVLKKFRIALEPSENVAGMIRQYEPIKKHIEKKLGIPVEVKIVSDYSALVEAMRAGHIDAIYTGGFEYLITHRETGAVPLVVAVQRMTGKSHYRSTIIARYDSDIRTIEDLKGKTFAFVDPISTSGSLYPKYMLKSRGFDIAKDFKTTYYAGSHDAVMLAVKNKKVDAGAVADMLIEQAVDKGIIKMGTHPGEITPIIWSGKVPGPPIVVRGDLDPKFFKKLQDAYTSIPSETLKALKYWGKILGYEPTSDAKYADLRKLTKTLGMDLSAKALKEK